MDALFSKFCVLNSLDTICSHLSITVVEYF